MKTLAVVAALAAVAVAAPALHEDNYWGNVKSGVAYPQIFKRDRKSTPVDPKTGLLPTPGAPVLSTPTDLPTARHFALKKPIIVKKKEGYHVYRDSDEEQADSRETCVKQVKVKLCDTEQTVPKSFDMTRASGLEDPAVMMTEDEMKHSIKLAKEAVENIQRDLKKAEHKTGERALTHDNSETDAELHHDIEVARQALEHIHHNFGNLESMSLHELKPNNLNEETKEDHQFGLARTEEERLAQWKEAVENIHRNVEIARNIEDSFKLDDEQIALPEVDATHTEMRATDIENDKLMIEDQTKHEKPIVTENLKSAVHDDDMSTSAATLSETKVINHINEDLLKSALKENDDKKITSDTKEPARESEMKIMASNHELKTEEMESQLQEELKESKIENIKRESTPEESEKNKEELKHKDDTILEHAKDATEAIDTTMFVKSAEPTKTDKNTPILMDETKNIHDELKKSPMKEKTVEEILMPLMGELADPSDIEMKSAEPMKHFHEETKGHMETNHHHAGHHQIHMPHHHEHMHHQSNMGHSQMRWDHDSQNMQMAAMKAAEDVQSIDHHHHLTEHAMRNHFDAKNLALHQQHHMLPETMMQGKSADMDNTMQSNFYNMRDSTGDNQRFRWRPAHESARSAYGPAPVAAAASNGGAVGLFPNANVGSCGIPLLLSCNPSVVSGSLAKSHSYGAPAPAYRTEDDFNFHNKRDIKKTETLTTLKRLPTQHTKTATLLVAKQ